MVGVSEMDGDVPSSSRKRHSNHEISLAMFGRADVKDVVEVCV